MVGYCVDVCDECGFTTQRHLIHTSDGRCYCTHHYLLHLLHEEIEEEREKMREQDFPY